MGYQDWGDCDVEKTIVAAAQGVNVIMWFAVNLAADAGLPQITGGPDPLCVAEVAEELEALNLTTTHLLSIGGWDAPHPAPGWSGAQWFDVWRTWNEALPRPYDGFDWDLEGADSKSAPSNNISAATLGIMVEMSEAAAAAGVLVTMVPPQSYLDESTAEFNPSLLNTYADWHPDFAYHGRNCYAYVLAAAAPSTFSLVTVQLYESWSRADEAMLRRPDEAPAYLQALYARLMRGWTVDFGTSLPRARGPTTVRVRPSQLVVGLAHGGLGGKMTWVPPAAAAKAYRAAPAHARPRGYAFWNIKLEGSGANGTETPFNFAPTLNSFLHTRAAAPPGSQSAGIAYA